MTPIELLQLAGPPVAFVALGLIGGLIAERLLVRLLRHAIEKAAPGGGSILVRHLRGQIVIWCTIGGSLLALETVANVAPVLAELFQLLLRAALVLSITIICARLAGDLVSFAARRSGDALPAPAAFVRLSQGIILVIGILVALQSVGIDVMPILAALGVGGLAVGLALQAPLTNLFAGIYIMLSRKVKPGDYIRLRSTGQEGYVVDTDFKHTTIRELPNNLIIIPNSAIMTTDIHNFNLPEKEMSVVIPIGVSYDSDLEHVEAVTIEVAKETLLAVEGGVSEFQPFIRFNSFEDYSIKLSCILRAREFVDRFMLTHDFIKRLHRRYQQEGIEIPFPIRTLHIREQHAQANGASVLPRMAVQAERRDGTSQGAEPHADEERSTAETATPAVR